MKLYADGTQGCKIFLGAKKQNGENISKWSQTY
jgi:hypothetical protein